MNIKQSIISLISVIFLGVINHFIYDVIQSDFIAIFVPINESIFEHLKLIYFPFIFIGILRYFFSSNKLFFSHLLVSVLLGLVLVPVLYYFYTTIFQNNHIVNIIIFIICCISQEFTFYQLNKKQVNLYITPSEIILTFFAITLAFIVFTFFPPDIFIFIENKY